jgi:extradiol dioxygenase family protein
MAQTRLPVLGGTRTGLLCGEHLQIAYATNDLARAKALFADRYGITRFAQLGGPLPEGSAIEVEFAWCGGVMYELLTASGAGSQVYMERPPASGFAIVQHHYGYLVRDADEWAALRRTIDQGGWTKRIDQDIPGFMRQVFIEAPELGHLLEFLWPEPAGMAFLFDTVPNN